MAKMKKLTFAFYILILSGLVNTTVAQLIHVEDRCNKADISLYITEYKSVSDATVYWVDTIAKARLDKQDGRWLQISNRSYADLVVCFTKYPFNADYKIYVTDGIAEASIKNDNLRRAMQ